MTMNAKNFALACGILWAVGIFILGIISTYSNWGAIMHDVFASVYIGYNPGWIGSLVGAIWAFIDAFIGGFLLIWLYNRFDK